MKKILILFGHPSIKRSRINAALRSAVEGLEGVTVHDLYAAYPDFFIDVPYEQQLCEAHDILIFQHPLYWYSTPAIFKEWMDLVLEHGWAYGFSGKALEGKTFFQALTAGGDRSTYTKGGANLFTIDELTTPCQATANLCKMRCLPPFAILGINRGLAAIELRRHAENYRRTILALRDDRLNLEQAARYEFLNSDLNSIIREA